MWVTDSKLPTNCPPCVPPRLTAVIYDSGANGFKSSETDMLYTGERSAEVCGGMRCVVPASNGVNVYVKGCNGRGGI